MESDLIVQLSKFGFTQNEAKAYLGLIESHPATGYELSQHSGIPRSAIYEILRKLELGGIIWSEGKKPVHYFPIPSENLAIQLTSRFKHNIHNLKDQLSELKKPSSSNKTWNIKGYDSMIDNARSMIDNANESVYISMWGREFSELKVQLSQAESRGLNICMFSFTKLSHSFGSVYSYEIDEEVLREIWHRQVVMVVDKKNSILGGADKTVDNQCIFSDNSAIVDTCLNYLILDLTLFSQRRKIDVQKDISNMMSLKTDQLRNLLK